MQNEERMYAGFFAAVPRYRKLISTLCVLCGYFLCQSDVAFAAPQQVVPVDGAAFFAELVSIAANGNVSFRVKDKTDPVVTKLTDLVRWGHPVGPRAQTLVALADGGRLVTAADWSGGAAVRMNGDDLVALSDTWGEVKLPKHLVRGIVFAQRNRPEERERLIERMRSEPSPAPSSRGSGNSSLDAVLLTNGDRLTGKLAALERGSLTLNSAAGETKLPLSRVEAIVFHNGSQPAADNRSARFAVGMRDGSLVFASEIEANQQKASIELANGVKLPGGKVNDIVALQSLGGPFVYLSDLAGADYRFVPYLSVEWPLNRDRNVLGGPLTVDDQRYLKGIGLHSAARLTYKLDGTYRKFDAMVALDDAAKGRGSVVFGVYLQRDGQWAEAYKSGTVRGGEAPQPVSVDVRGAQGLTLTVDYADRGDELDYADWLDARLVR